MASPFHQYLGTESINIYFCTVLRLEYVAEVGYIFSGFMVQGGRLMGVWKQWGVLWSADCFLTSQRSGMQLGTEHLGMNPWIQAGQVFFLFICQSVSVSGKEHKQFV